MHYYPDDQSKGSLDRIRRGNVCLVCGRQLSVYWDLVKKQSYIACSGQVHEGIAKEYKPPVEDYQSSIRRDMELEKEVGTQVAKRLETLPKQGQLTQPEAMHILSLVYPEAPEDEIIRCAILCRDFGLHPLMKEVYIIGFKKWNKEHTKVLGESWVTVLGINATRKLMSQRGTYSYIDDTPRLMTEEEQKRIFGEGDRDNIVAITKLRTKDGLEAPGYGRWPKEKQPQGTDKGNTKANMAFIRSERNAFGRLSPDALPPGLEVIDEAYVEGVGQVDRATGEIVEVEATVLEEKEVPPEPEQTTAIELVGDVSDPEASIQGEQLHHLSEITSKAGSNLKALAEWCNNNKKWGIKIFNDLKVWQYVEIVQAYSKGM